MQIDVRRQASVAGGTCSAPENGRRLAFFSSLPVSSPSNAWHKGALLPTDEISDTEPVPPVLVDRTAQSVRGRAR